MPKTSSPVTLIVMEAGSEWPSWVPSRNEGDVVVVAQPCGSPTEHLVESVLHRLSTFERTGRRADLGIVAVAACRSGEIEPARWTILRALLAHLKRVEAGSLVLSCSERASTDARASLLELAGALHRQAGDNKTSTGVRFHAPSPARATDNLVQSAATTA